MKRSFTLISLFLLPILAFGEAEKAVAAPGMVAEGVPNTLSIYDAASHAIPDPNTVNR